VTDLICPSCGKSNSDKFDICQFCGTALKLNPTEPLAPIHTGDVPVKMKTSDLERTLPGWLRDARQASDAQDPILNIPPPSVGDSQGSPPQAKPPEKTGAASPLDLLAGLSQVGNEEEEAPDWLKSLQGGLPETVHSTPSSETEQTAFQDDDQQQTAAFNQDLGLEGGTSQPPAPFDPQAPAWMETLEDLGGTPVPPQPGPPPATLLNGDPSIFDDLPDWMAALTEGAAGPAHLPARPVSGALENQEPDPDWLSNLGGDFTPDEKDEPAEVGSPETPDWLSELSNVSPKSEPLPADTVADPGQPDWLAELSTGTPASEIGSEPPPAAVDQPEWLNNLPESSPLPGPDASLPETLTGANTLPADAIPEWMANLPQEPTAAQPAAPTRAEIPSWLSDAMGEPPAQEPVPVAPKTFDSDLPTGTVPIDKAGPLPEWLAGLDQSIAASQQPPAIHEEDTPSEISAGSGALLQPDADLPGWLNDLPSVASGTAAQPTPEPAPGPEEVPPQSTGKKSQPTAEDQNIESILSMDMPDWLSGFTGPEKEQKITKNNEASAEDSNLLPAELPSWVQAMRPMESVMAAAGDGVEEQETADDGPLAGLSSILPVQAGQAEAHIPKSYSIKLLANETQQAQAELLANLLKSESEPQPISRLTKAPVIRQLRWLIAAVLLISAIIPAILGSNYFPSPVAPSETAPLGAFIQAINNLPDNSTVLVVVDYQPGYTAEMDAAAGPVIEELMSRAARLAFISTSPLGSFMAERLVQKNTAVYQYQAGEQYVNLGYLPGEAGGIKLFAEQPRSSIGQDPILGDLWDVHALQGATVNNVTSLANFSAVIVLTDNTDTGRLWIEQARPVMMDKPLLLVVSAQAEPMLRPYVLSGQVNGLLAGLEGGLTYQNTLGQDGLARKNWDAFGAAMLASELIIIIGAVWGLVISLRARRIVKEQDEA